MSSREMLARDGLLQEQQHRQQRMLRFDVAVPEEVVHDSEMLEKSLSSLHMSLKVEEMEAELVASIAAKEREEAKNETLNLRLTALTEQLQEVRGEDFFCLPSGLRCDGPRAPSPLASLRCHGRRRPRLAERLRWRTRS
jgi:hypothetical protein